MRLTPARSTLLVTSAVFAVVACNQILGNHSPDVADPPEEAAAPVPQPDGGAVTADPDGGVGCAAGQKVCFGACVNRAPENGCGAEDCAPCAAIAQAEVGCAGSGACFLAACRAGFADCNSNASDGCETDLADPVHCGQCTGSCTTFCSPADAGFSCQASCQLPAVACDADAGRCNDLDDDPMHCGTCDTVCPGAAHATPRCSNRTCDVVCDPGYNDCLVPGTCVPDDDDVCGARCRCAPLQNPLTVKGHTCAQGICYVECASTFVDSNGDPTDGCECRGEKCAR